MALGGLASKPPRSHSIGLLGGFRVACIWVKAGVKIMQGDFFHGGYFKGSKNAKDPACSAILGGGSAHTSGHPVKPQHFADSLGGNNFWSKLPPNFWSIRRDNTVGDQCPTKGHEFNVMKHFTPCSTCHALDARMIAKIVNRVPDNGQLLWVIGADGLHTIYKRA